MNKNHNSSCDSSLIMRKFSHSFFIWRTVYCIFFSLFNDTYNTSCWLMIRVCHDNFNQNKSILWLSVSFRALFVLVECELVVYPLTEVIWFCTRLSVIYQFNYLQRSKGDPFISKDLLNKWLRNLNALQKDLLKCLLYSKGFILLCPKN